MNVTSFNFGFYSYNHAGQLEDLSNMDVDSTDNEIDDYEYDGCQHGIDYDNDGDDVDALNTTLPPNAAATIPKLLTSTPHRNSSPKKNDSLDTKKRFNLDENDNEVHHTVVPHIRFNEVETKLHSASTSHVSSDYRFTAAAPPSAQPTQFNTLFDAQTKLWANELRAKALQMAKVNSACQGKNTRTMRQQMASSFMQKLEHITAALANQQVDEKLDKNHVLTEISTLSHANAIKDKINFFNSITLAPTATFAEQQPASNQNTGKFLSLLKTNKVTNQATIKMISTPATPSTTFPAHNFSNGKNALNDLLTPQQHSAFQNAASTLGAMAANDCMPMHAGEIFSRKNAAVRINKTPLEKIRFNGISRQNTSVTSGGTKPHMHSLMEDLSLVVPVRLRVAEYERRVNSEK